MASTPELRRAPGGAEPPIRSSSAWSPLRHRAFRILWGAQLASNVGTWMQLVGAQWLIGSLGGGTLLVALVQTATTLPIFLLALPAGALGDVLDRRRLLLGAQGFMLVAAGTLAALTLFDAVSPVAVLVLVFALGLGQALTLPAWQATQPELVDRDEIPRAAALNGVSFNLGRAIGPALGGALIAAVGPALVFGVNAVSFLAVVAALVTWRRPPTPDRALGAEHIRGAVRVGARYVRSSPGLRAVLVRAVAFALPASALWALLPVVARGPLGLGSDGYGLLLGAVGLGAVAGAGALPLVRARLSTGGLIAAASVAFAAACLGLAFLRQPLLVGLALALAGVGWISVLSSLNASAQALLPNWARARGMSFYLLVFMAAQAAGGALWGAVAQLAGVETALSAVAALLVLGLLGTRRFGLRSLEGPDLSPSSHWPEPQLVFEPEPDRGPVLITVEYRVPAEHHDAFRSAMRPVGRSRQRTGAYRWHLFQDGEDPDRFLETYVVATWQEHRRQHDERLTVRDQELEARALALTGGPGGPRVAHLISAYAEDR